MNHDEQEDRALASLIAVFIGILAGICLAVGVGAVLGFIAARLMQ